MPFRVFLSQTADQPHRPAIPSCCCRLITPGVPICAWRFATTLPPRSSTRLEPSRGSVRNKPNSKASLLYRGDAIARQSRSQHPRIPASCETWILQPLTVEVCRTLCVAVIRIRRANPDARATRPCTLPLESSARRRSKRDSPQKTHDKGCVGPARSYSKLQESHSNDRSRHGDRSSRSVQAFLSVSPSKTDPVRGRGESETTRLRNDATSVEARFPAHPRVRRETHFRSRDRPGCADVRMNPLAVHHRSCPCMSTATPVPPEGGPSVALNVSSNDAANSEEGTTTASDVRPAAAVPEQLPAPPMKKGADVA